jgi:hypothetical protein
MRIILMFIVISLPLLNYGQDCEICKIIANKSDTIPLTEFGYSEKQVHAVTVQVIDCRPDTLKLGYHDKGFLKKGSGNETNYFPFQFEYGTAAGLSRLSSDKLSGVIQKDIKLAVFIKTLWVYEGELSRLIIPDERRYNKTDLSGKEKNKLVFKADYFLEQNNEFIPLLRIDTSFTGVSSRKQDTGNIFYKFLHLQTEKIGQSVANRTTTKKGYAFPFVASKYANPAPPILKATVYKKGIYASYQEFLANNPGVQLRELIKEKVEDLAYTENEKGESILVRNMWGYCDGDRIFMFWGGKLHLW